MQHPSTVATRSRMLLHWSTAAAAAPATSSGSMQRSRPTQLPRSTPQQAPTAQPPGKPPHQQSPTMDHWVFSPVKKHAITGPDLVNLARASLSLYHARALQPAHSLLADVVALLGGEEAAPHIDACILV